MMAFKCDACGKYEDFEQGTRKKRILVRYIDRFGQNNTTDIKSFDICEECLNKVLTLFNQKEASDNA